MPSYQPPGYPGAHGHTTQPTQTGQPSHAQQQSADQDLEIEDEPPRKRRRWMIAAALAGSIAVGSGLAYAYKSFLGPRAKDEVPTARAPTGPTKVPPSDRGGTRIPNQDSQLLNARVPAQGGTAAGGADPAGSGFTDSNGVRRVPTVAVGPGGAPAAAPEAPRPPPGMTIVGGGGAGSPTLIGAPPPSLPPPQAASPPPGQPRMAAVPTAASAAPPPAQPAPPAPPRRAPAQPQEVEAGQQQAAVPPRPAAPKRPITGYVAALGYHRTQLEAMKMMADLQQRYEPLRDKKLEIVQSDESTRGLGIIFRVVGPKGSAASARELCTQLKQAGMPDRGCYTLGM